MANRPTVLMIAYHFPPVAGSSGLQRTLSFANALAESGWNPVVLTVSRFAYPRTSSDQESDVHPAVRVLRAPAFDATRHLAIRGRYWRRTAIPDNWSTWILTGLALGSWAMARYQPEVIWSTYPISSAHCIASGLATLFGRPWIADMRDPMVDEHYPEDPMKRRAYKSIEERVVRQARYMTFAAPGTRTMYLARYPRWLSQSSSMVIENGFEGQYFEQQRILSSDVQSGPVTLLHSGAIYPTERDPAPLLQSVARIRREGFGADRVRVRFRASGTEERISRISRRLGIQDQVCLDPQLPYREALAEMCNGNVLMIMQGAACNHQIPAKVYEYLQANQPIFGLVADDGDTAELLRRAGVQYLADISDERGIAEAIKRLVAEAEAGVLTSRLDREFVSGCDRRHRSKQLLSLLESCRSTG